MHKGLLTAAALVAGLGLGAVAHAGDTAFGWGQTVRSFADGFNNTVQRQLEAHPGVQQRITGAIDSAADFGTGFAAPEATGDERRMMRDALQFGFNPADSESDAALGRIRDWAEDDFETYPDRPSVAPAPAQPLSYSAPTATTPIPTHRPSRRLSGQQFVEGVADLFRR